MYIEPAMEHMDKFRFPHVFFKHVLCLSFIPLPASKVKPGHQSRGGKGHLWALLALCQRDSVSKIPWVEGFLWLLPPPSCFPAKRGVLAHWI